MPKTGKWSVAIKKFFGWVMIGTGEFFLVQAGILFV
jgi:thiol:disulfide interchange protein